MKKLILIIGVVFLTKTPGAWGNNQSQPKKTPKVQRKVVADRSKTRVRNHKRTRPIRKKVKQSYTILLFADLREATSSCGCGQIIRLARKAKKIPGVFAREFDSRKNLKKAKQYNVRKVPAVIILGKDGREKARFVGESASVVARIRKAVKALRKKVNQPK